MLGLGLTIPKNVEELVRNLFGVRVETLNFEDFKEYVIFFLQVVKGWKTYDMRGVKFIKRCASSMVNQIHLNKI
jgi:hypothetical protein